MKNKDKYDLTKLTFKIEGENNPSQVFKILDGTNVVFEKPILLNRADLSLFLSWLSEDQEISKSVIQLSELQVKRNSLHKRIKEESKE